MVEQQRAEHRVVVAKLLDHQQRARTSATNFTNSHELFFYVFN
ncbi:MAG: hypothetical protein SGI89_11625 [bacterium]|nr:hypothetical protein [bacterium]